MRESEFIRRQQQHWQAFESLFASRRKSPRKLSRLYVQITEDLAQARTFYPNRSVRVYLNFLAQRVQYSIHAARPRRWSVSLAFWRDTLPRVLYAVRHDLAICAAVFVLACGIGWLSGSQDETFAQLILGEDYVTMTRANIDSGDPMQVYKASKPWPMFWRIATNNLMIDALLMVSGVVLGIGSLFVLLFNGIMVGTFQEFFADFGLLRESSLAIWQHGVLEMMAAVLAATAGLSMGRGLAFPGTFTRAQAFRLSARHAVKLMALVIPMTLLAAVLESWVTRQTDVADVARAFGIFLSLALVLGYTVVYPWLRGRRGDFWPLTAERLAAPRDTETDLDQVRPAGALFALGLVAYRRTFPLLGSRIIPFCLFLAGLAVVFYERLLETELRFLVPMDTGNPAFFFAAMPKFLVMTAQFGHTDAFPFLWPVQLAGMVLLLSLVFSMLSGFRAHPLDPPQPPMLRLSRLATHALPFTALLFFAAPLGQMAFALVMPFFVFAAASAWWEGNGFFAAWTRAFRLIWAAPGTVLAAYLAAMATAFLGTWLAHSPLMGLLMDAVESNFLLDVEAVERFRVGYVVFVAHAAFYILFPMVIATLAVAYFNAREVLEAKGLAAEWKRFGKQRDAWK